MSSLTMLLIILQYLKRNLMNVILNVSCSLLVLAFLISGCVIHFFPSVVEDRKGRSYHEQCTVSLAIGRDSCFDSK